MRLSHVAVPAVLVLALTAAGCGGDKGPSKEEKQAQAKTAVCAARADIQTQVTTLKDLTPNLASVPQIKTSVNAIVGRRRQDQGRRAGPEARCRAAGAGREPGVCGQGRGGREGRRLRRALGDIAGQLKSAIQQLEATYEQVLTPIAC